MHGSLITPFFICFGVHTLSSSFSQMNRIVTFSLRGTTVQRASKKRPGVPILALCPYKETARKLALSWGVYPELPKAGSYGYTVAEETMFDTSGPVVEESTDDFDLVLRNACRAALSKGLVSDPSDLLVVTAGLPFGTPGASNIIRVMPAAGPEVWVRSPYGRTGFHTYTSIAVANSLWSFLYTDRDRTRRSKK